MDTTDFDIEFNFEVPDPRDVLRLEAERRLWDLVEGKDDIIGAAVGLEELSGEETPHTYQARVVAYMRPENVAATEKGDTAELALKGALTALERQIYDLRAKLRETWKQP